MVANIGFGAGPQTGVPPLTVLFICTFDGGVAPYSWTLDYGDGSKDQGASLTPQYFELTHTYVNVGTFTAMFTVTDNTGTPRSSTVTIDVSEVTPPPDGAVPDLGLLVAAVPLFIGAFSLFGKKLFGRQRQ